MQPDKFLRWDYDYVELGEPRDYSTAYNRVPLSVGADGFDDDDFAPADVRGDGLWDLGSSSSYSQASTVSMGERSPVDFAADKDGDSWEGDTLASGSDVEKR